MNTRLQVEHPVTECVTGVDLVSLMLDVAEGKPLPFGQGDVRIDGWAMEARLYAEDPARGFLPQTGRVAALEFAAGDGVRVDAGVGEGDVVTAHYDPMIAKVIAHGATRAEAAARLAAALERTTLLGLTTNAPFLVALLRDVTFLRGEADTGYIERSLDAINASAGAVLAAEDLALAAAVLAEPGQSTHLAGWNSRGSVPAPLRLQHGDSVIEARAAWTPRGVVADYDGARAEIEIVERAASMLRYRIDGRTGSARCLREGDVVEIERGAIARRFVDLARQPASEGGAAADVVKAPMAGVVTTVAVTKGQRVAKGDTVATIEAMKMEHRLTAPRDGVVEEVKAVVGAQVAIRAVLVSLAKE